VRLLTAPNAPDDPSLRVAGMFSSLAHLQDQLMEIGERRIARMDELGIDKQLLLLTSPGVQVLEPAEGTAPARLAQLLDGAISRWRWRALRSRRGTANGQPGPVIFHTGRGTGRSLTTPRPAAAINRIKCSWSCPPTAPPDAGC
jgi:hypothetical protein